MSTRTRRLSHVAATHCVPMPSSRTEYADRDRGQSTPERRKGKTANAAPGTAASSKPTLVRTARGRRARWVPARLLRHDHRHAGRLRHLRQRRSSRPRMGQSTAPNRPRTNRRLPSAAISLERSQPDPRRRLLAWASSPECAREGVTQWFVAASRASAEASGPRMEPRCVGGLGGGDGRLGGRVQDGGARRAANIGRCGSYVGG